MNNVLRVKQLKFEKRQDGGDTWYIAETSLCDAAYEYHRHPEKPDVIQCMFCLRDEIIGEAGNAIEAQRICNDHWCNIVRDALEFSP